MMLSKEPQQEQPTKSFIISTIKMFIQMVQELKSKSNSNCNHASIDRPATRAMQSKHQAVRSLASAQRAEHRKKA